ncbi:MAG: hypothetical protein AB1486_08485 [Planctomycetota bacterium]
MSFSIPLLASPSSQLEIRHPCRVQRRAVPYGTTMLRALASGIIAVSVALVGFDCSEAAAQCGMIEAQKLVALDGELRHRFGNAVAMQDDLAVVGAHRDDLPGPSAGSAYVFRNELLSWVQVQKLVANDAAAEDEFGTAVAIDGNVIVVGAPLDDNARGLDAGAAYVYRFDGSHWIQEKKLLASNGNDEDWFGWSVAVSGNTILVGAPFGTGPLFNTGLAYVFRYAGGSWVEEQILDPTSAGGEYRFGFSVALAGGIAAVGAPSDQMIGAVYTFHDTGTEWELAARLVVAGGQIDDELGAAVALDDTTLLAGAPGQDGAAAGSGAGHLFRFDGTNWLYVQKLAPPGTQAGDRVGAAVALEGPIAVLGAPEADRGAADTGAAFVYQQSGPNWVLKSGLVMSDAAREDLLGQGVATNGFEVLCGAPWDDPQGNLSGSACLFLAVQELVLEIDPVTIDPWDTMTVSTFYGPPGNPVLLTIMKVNGVPVFVPVVLAEFDANSRWVTAVLIRPGFSGLTVDAVTFALQYCGGAQMSNVVTVSFN